MEQNKEIDALAGIAARASAVQADIVLIEQEPPVLPDIRLPGPLAGDAAAFSPRPPHTAESLTRELVLARVNAIPFLRDLSPPLPSTRAVISLPTADWRLEPSANWHTISLPHYGGPIGRARAWYRFPIQLEEAHLRAGSLWACFGGADYQAAVFFNGELAGTHEGFFASFAFEIGRYAREGVNELLVRVDNDAICAGNKAWDDARSGDKIYGATGLGWDEPGLGWHHCPPGMGLHRPVHLETRPAVHLHDIFVRPLLEENAAEIWVEVFNTHETSRPISLKIAIHGQNFECEPLDSSPELEPAEPGLSRFRTRIAMSGARRWSPATPWLYRAQVVLCCDDTGDASSTQFGMRSFILDESAGADGQRGKFYLNGEAVRLRGANTMGHEQQCVFRGDLDQLRDDILLAKLANMNFLRFTQRPVEPEVYDLCDRLGIMAQSDLPLFGYLRRNKFCEAVRQAAEMERLLRRHASAVLTSFINEPFPAAWGDKTHRHLSRVELENFFTAATHAVHVENPDRQIKPIDGDYQPPGPGLPDNHCYAGWYNGHGLDLGRIHRGYWIGVKAGWNYACGEFGSEGLDPEHLMRSCYPAAWLPKNESDETAWTPLRIYKAQTGTHYHLWMEPGNSMSEWIRRSQEHQAWITRLMTEAFRRDNRMVSFAIHLFIDAWPAGWMKSIMDCQRGPKPAYFAYREALAPLAVNLRLDRTAYFSGERLEAEVWLGNDTNKSPDDLQLAYQLEHEGRIILSGRAPAHIRPDEAIFQGRITLILPETDGRTVCALQLGLLSGNGECIHDATVKVDLFPKPPQSRKTSGTMAAGKKAKHLAAEMGLIDGGKILIVDDPTIWSRESKRFHRDVAGGATALLIEFPPGEYSIGGDTIRFETAGMEPRHFVSRDQCHPLAQTFQENDFRFWHDPALDRPSPLLHTLFFANDSWQPILHTGQGGWGIKWEPALAVAEKPYGKGRFIICQITLAARLNNPAALLFARALLTQP